MGNFRVKVGVQAESLADLLAAELGTPLGAGSALRTEAVVVQSQGMAQWLRLELASRLGVCMNVEFPFPRKFIQDTLHQFWPEETRSAAFEPEQLAWRIFQRLHELSDLPEFEPVKAYLAGGGSSAQGGDPRKTYQLAVRLADCMDQYGVYRPEWIKEWEQGGRPEAHTWQAELWRAVVSSQNGVHPARLMARFRDEARSMATPASLPARVFVVMTTLMPPIHLEVFKALTAHMKVVLLVSASCRKWFTGPLVPVEDANPLLQSGGRYGRELALLLRGLGGEMSAIEGVSASPATMLGTIQQDLIEDRDPDRERVEAEESEDAGLRSIQVHACHSPMREVEVLHDHILHWLNQGTVQPREILVVTPNLETYAPCIEAVFDAEVGEPMKEAGKEERWRRTIPFNIADRSARRDSVASDAFVRLLDLVGGRLGASSVLDLLEAGPVREQFQLTERELGRVARWIEQSGIRWGEDAAQREKLGLPALPETTWRFGLDRLLFGYAMPGLEQAAAVGKPEGTSLVPCIEVEGEGAEVMGRFVEFADRLFKGLKQLEEPRPRVEWAKQLARLLEGMFDLETDPEGARSVRSAIESLAGTAGESDAQSPVPFAAIREALRSRLEESRGTNEVFRGGVSICGMRLMRGVQFKVVCVLGLNDGAFPRQDRRPGFDLLAQGQPATGDPSPRHDDRYLFLQLLQSARERFYLSYVGRSDRDNAELPPSVLVSELLDYVGARFAPVSAAVGPMASTLNGQFASRGEVTASTEVSPAESSPGQVNVKPEDWVRVQHPLHRFSSLYFTEVDAAKTGRGRLFSYSAEGCEAARQLAAGRGAPWVFATNPLPLPGHELRTVSVADLVAFFRNPSRFFLEQRLRLRLKKSQEQELADDELFDVNSLERFNLENELLEALMAAPCPAEVADAIQRRWTAEGRLPLGQPGEAEHAKVVDYSTWLARKLTDQVAQPLESLTVDLPIGECRVVGTLKVRTEGGGGEESSARWIVCELGWSIL